MSSYHFLYFHSGFTEHNNFSECPKLTRKQKGTDLPVCTSPSQDFFQMRLQFRLSRRYNITIIKLNDLLQLASGSDSAAYSPSGLKAQPVVVPEPETAGTEVLPNSEVSLPFN